MTEDIGDLVGEIYDAIDDTERWRRLNDRLVAGPSLAPEIAHHLETARRVHERYAHLRGAIDASAGIYDQLALGALVVGHDGSLLWANGTATCLLAERGGLELVEGRVRASDSQDDARLHDAIALAATRASEDGNLDMAFVAVARQDKPPFSVLAVPSSAPSHRFFEDRLVTLVVIDPDLAVLPAADTLRALYGFTTREAEFALLLMRGLSVKEASVALRVSMTTARTFLAQITAKTDCHSQGELMVRLLATPRTHGRRA